MLASIGIPPKEDPAMAKAKELPLVRRRIEALLRKTEANGCTAGEAAAALEKAKELMAKYGIERRASRRPPKPSEPSGSAASGPKPPKTPRVAGSGRGKGIGATAEALILDHPDWTYSAVAAEVNRRIEGAKASEKSVRWYACRMRRRGDAVPLRRKAGRVDEIGS